MSYLIALRVVVTMVLCLIPGYAMVKAKLIDKNSLPGFAAVLLYICQPSIIYYTFKDITLTGEVIGDFARVFIFSMLFMTAILVAGFLFLKNKYDDAGFRIATVAFAFGNCSFFGVPLLEAAMPGCSEAIAYSSVYGLAMNLLGWTVATAIITRNPKYIRLKKALLNPVVIGFAITMLILLTNTELPDDLNNMLGIMGKMATPLSMLLVGMRLASMEFSTIFMGKRQYIFVLIKQVLIPLVALLLLKLVTNDLVMRNAMLIVFCCPCASVVSNFAEMLGDGQEMAANLVIVGTILSIITIPIMMLLCGM